MADGGEPLGEERADGALVAGDGDAVVEVASGDDGGGPGGVFGLESALVVEAAFAGERVGLEFDAVPPGVAALVGADAGDRGVTGSAEGSCRCRLRLVVVGPVGRR